MRQFSLKMESVNTLHTKAHVIKPKKANELVFFSSKDVVLQNFYIQHTLSLQ
jgi:hypothetical protein